MLSLPLRFTMAAAFLCLPLHADEGFKSIFNGNDLAGWDGDPLHWSAMEGVIRGDSTKNRAKSNTFIVWRDGKLKNFELKLKYRIHSGNNSGVQYRSKEVQKWVVSGYQAEVENRLGKTGFLYHERGRGWLVDVGDFMEIAADSKKRIVGEVSDWDTIMKAPYHTDKDWNAYHFICRGNHVIHYLNGYQTIELIDHETANRCMEGILALQVHGGSPMTVDFKDIEVHELTESYGEAIRLANTDSLEGWTFSPVAAKQAFSIVEYEGPASKRRRGAGNQEININGSLKTTGGEGTASPANASDQFILRFQKNDGAADGIFKTVKGWSAHEVSVINGKTSYKINGVATDADSPVVQGKIALRAGSGEYRNLVLIPIQ
ncbi:MAG: DUF1080 domain-containing protein [Planctomycetota bacterium]|nr:DUF1080 domain-containing protein [Planctomycetota bacterium]MDA1143089.1 DUF1080 domain-containing protein [Planctomycetota bacterium]